MSLKINSQLTAQQEYTKLDQLLNRQYLVKIILLFYDFHMWRLCIIYVIADFAQFCVSSGKYCVVITIS